MGHSSCQWKTCLHMLEGREGEGCRPCELFVYACDVMRMCNRRRAVVAILWTGRRTTTKKRKCYVKWMDNECGWQMWVDG